MCFWGEGEYGQTGDNFPSSYYRDTPTQVGTDTWSKVFAGWKVSFGIKPDGTLWAWRNNDMGQLGGSISSIYKKQKKIGNSTDWKNVTTGLNHSIGIKNNGELWTWGINSSGELGDGTYVNKSAPNKI